MREFLGLAGFYRKFIFRFAHVALPLYELTGTHDTFHWTDDCAAAFELLKKCLTKAPILALPNRQGAWILRTDASKYALGAVLL